MKLFRISEPHSIFINSMQQRDGFSSIINLPFILRIALYELLQMENSVRLKTTFLNDVKVNGKCGFEV